MGVQFQPLLRFQNEQPKVPFEVELFLAGERDRFVSELEGIQTTEFGRDFLDEAVGFSKDAVAELLTGTLGGDERKRALGVTAVSLIAFNVNSVIESLSGFPDYIALPRPERAKQTGYIETACSLGGLLRHGLKVGKWYGYHAGAELNVDNVVSCGTAAMLGEMLDKGKKEVRRATGTLLSTKRLGAPH